MRCVREAAVAAVIGLLCVSLPATAQDARPVSRALPSAPAPSDLRATLDVNDELAALDAIHVALSTVADGGTYVWHRHHGRLSGILQPTSSYRNASGAPCRHLVMMLVAGSHTQRVEGFACRTDDKRWILQS
jgi:surface antigen